MKLVAKSVLLLGIVIAIQTGMYVSKGGDRRFVSTDVKEYRVLMEKNPNLIYFGDSVNQTIAAEDQDKREIAQMIGGFVPGSRVESLDHGAYHAELYLAFLRNIIASDRRPGGVVVPINLRSFSAEWRYRPEYQFAKEQALTRFPPSGM